MKKTQILIIFLVLLMQTSALAQQNDKIDFYEGKVHNFNTMKNFGIGLTAFGAGTILGGIIYQIATQQVIEEMIIGTAAVGVVTMTPGVLLWTLGISKKKFYQNKLDRITLQVNPNMHRLISLNIKL